MALHNFRPWDVDVKVLDPDHRMILDPLDQQQPFSSYGRAYPTRWMLNCQDPNICDQPETHQHMGHHPRHVIHPERPFSFFLISLHAHLLHLLEENEAQLKDLDLIEISREIILKLRS